MATRDMEEILERIKAAHDLALAAHLKRNNLGERWLPVAREVIVRAEDGQWTVPVKLPNGAVRTVQDAVKGMKLAHFIHYPELDKRPEIRLG